VHADEGYLKSQNVLLKHVGLRTVYLLVLALVRSEKSVSRDPSFSGSPKQSTEIADNPVEKDDASSES
jgi:hypothetical protein